jgi:hypothetical protein
MRRTALIVCLLLSPAVAKAFDMSGVEVREIPINDHEDGVLTTLANNLVNYILPGGSRADKNYEAMCKRTFGDTFSYSGLVMGSFGGQTRTSILCGRSNVKSKPEERTAWYQAVMYVHKSSKTLQKIAGRNCR